MNAHRRRRYAPFDDFRPLRPAVRHGAWVLVRDWERLARCWRWLRSLEPSEAFGLAVSVAFVLYLIAEALR